MKKTTRKIFPQSLLSLFVFGVFATAQQPKAAGRVIVHAGKLLDVRSGKTLTDQAIVIDGGKIVSVGPFAQATRSPGDRLIDLGERHRSAGLDRRAHSPDRRSARCRLRRTGYLHSAVNPDRRAQCAPHSRSRLHHRAQCGRRRLQRRRAARRHQRRRCARAAHAGERARLSALPEATATRTCCPSNTTTLRMAWPTAWKACSTRFARPSSTAPT